jgi:hypothetical protein
MTLRSGLPEHITKSWKTGGRDFQGYIVLVNVEGDDTYEVGLSALRKCLGIHCLTPKQTLILSSNRPEYITFAGTCHESYNDLQITEESAVEWANKVNRLI